MRVVADTAVGQTVDVVVFRDGKEETLQVKIGLLEEATLAAAPGAPQSEAPPLREETVLGMTVAAHQRRPAPAVRPRPATSRGLIVTELDATPTPTPRACARAT